MIATRPRLEDLAANDEAVAPLARLQQIALNAAADAVWAAAIPALDRQRAIDGLPLLHGQMLAVDGAALRRLALQLASEIVAAQPGAQPLHTALQTESVDLPALAGAAIRQDLSQLEEVAASVGLRVDLVASFAQLLVPPLLRAAGVLASPLLEGVPWDAGYCPVCAAWPLLAERRGLDRKRVLRCGRCAAEWSYGLQKCPYCGNHDYKTLGYLAPEAQREARQAVTCDACQGYVKTITTVSAIPAADLPVHDLTTLELDVAALEQSYSRPEEPGFPLEVQVVVRPSRSAHVMLSAAKHLFGRSRDRG